MRLLRSAVLVGCCVAVSSLLFAQEAQRRDAQRAESAAVSGRLDRLAAISDPNTRADARAEIAAMRPSALTLTVLARRHAAGSDFLRNQIESIIGQMDFSDEPGRAFAAATRMTDIDLFVATSFGMGNSESAESRQMTLALMESHQFANQPGHAETTRYAIAHILTDTLDASDFAWLSNEARKGALSATQREVAVRAAERLPSPESAAFLRQAAALAQSDDERRKIERTLQAVEGVMTREDR